MIIRTILIATGISIAGGCSVSSSGYAGKASVNPASIVQINQHLEIPSRKARVYFQNGAEITKRNIDKIKTYCSVLMQKVHSRGEPLLSVSPGRFEIIKVRESSDIQNYSRHFNPITFTRYEVMYQVDMRLKSDEQPDVRSLVCVKHVGNFYRNYPTLQEIRIALGDAIEIETQDQ